MVLFFIKAKRHLVSCTEVKKILSPTIFFLFFLSITNNVKADIALYDSGIQAINASWFGNGDININSNNFCVKSFSGSPTAKVESYGVKTTNSAATNDRFRLQSTKDNSILPISISYIDTTNNNDDALEANTFSEINKTGSIDCIDNNAQIRISILATNLYQAQGLSDYQQNMSVIFKNKDQESGTYDFNIGVHIPDIMQITGLKDMNFGNWSGSGDANASSNMCIYRNSSHSDGYFISFNGGGANRLFSVANGQQHVSYHVDFSDGISTTRVTPGQDLHKHSNNKTSPSCSGGTNATVTASIPNQDLFASSVGDYSGYLTVTLSAQ